MTLNAMWSIVKDSMAEQSLNATYRQRLQDDASYQVLSASDAHPHIIARGLEDYHGINMPKKVGHMVIAFGRFDGGDQLQAQPWIAEPPQVSKDSPHFTFPSHMAAHNELGYKGKPGGDSGVLPPDNADGQLDNHRWNMYVGEHPDPGQSGYVAYAATPEVRPELLRNKLDAVAAATADGPLADHTVYTKYTDYSTPGALPTDHTVRIQNGEIQRVTTDTGGVWGSNDT